MSSANQTKISPTEAVERARKFIGLGTYVLGSGGYRPAKNTDDDPEPWTPHAQKNVPGPYCDCWGLVSWAFKQRRHRPGYNLGGSVVDDVNVDSAIEDARGINGKKARGELWGLVGVASGVNIGLITPMLGDLLVWPSIRNLAGKRLRVGHVGIVSHVGERVEDMRVIQCSSVKPYGAAIRETDTRSWISGEHANRTKFNGELNANWQALFLRAV